MSFSVQNWLSASILLVSVAVVSKGLGFFREILIAYYFGASTEVDAFMVALSLPMLLAGAIGAAYSSAVVPFYFQSLAAEGREGGNAVIGTAVVSATILSVLFLVPLAIMPMPFVHLIAPALPMATAQLSANLTRWLAVYVLGLNLVYLLTAIYHSIQHFRIPAVVDLAFNTITIFILVGCAVSMGIHALALGNVIGILLCILLLLFFLVKTGKVPMSTIIRSKGVQPLLLFVWPIILVEVFTQVSAITENYYASHLNEGSISALSYAKKITTTIVALLAFNLARGLFPTLSMMASEDRRQEALALLTKVNKQLIIVVLPIAVCLICYRKDIVQLLYFRGAFDAASLNMTSEAFTFYAAGLLVAVMEPILIMATYAFSDTMVPLVTSLLGIAVLIVLLQVLTPLFGLGGIALGVSLTCLVRVVALMVYLEQYRRGGQQFREVIRISLTSLACAIIAFAPISFLCNKVSCSPANLLLILFISSGFYVAFAHLVMNEEADLMRKRLSEILKSFK